VERDVTILVFVCYVICGHDSGLLRYGGIKGTILFTWVI
jgi:hypothetical protein